MSERPHQPLAYIVGANICALRKKLGMSQAALAKELGVATAQLSRIERGSVAPRFNRLEKIVEILQCTPAELFVTGNEDIAKIREPMSREAETLYLAERLVKLLRAPVSHPQSC